MNKSNRTSIKLGAETITMGAAGALKGFSCNIFDLIALAEAVQDAQDGEQILVKELKIHSILYSEDSFGIIPIVVQTAGTWTDTVDLTDDCLEDFLRNSINDEFGYQKIREYKMSRRVPSIDATSGTGYEHAIQTVYHIPQNVIQIINRAINSERLQELIFGFIGTCKSNSQAVYINKAIEIDYQTRKKNIVLR